MDIDNSPQIFYWNLLGVMRHEQKNALIFISICFMSSFTQQILDILYRCRHQQPEFLRFSHDFLLPSLKKSNRNAFFMLNFVLNMPYQKFLHWSLRRSYIDSLVQKTFFQNPTGLSACSRANFNLFASFDLLINGSFQANLYSNPCILRRIVRLSPESSSEWVLVAP